MHIKQITISNFRSFRQQPEIHPFAATTNCVVGRNGSGKSNLFDAVQFVLLSPRFAILRSVRFTMTTTCFVYTLTNWFWYWLCFHVSYPASVFRFFKTNMAISWLFICLSPYHFVNLSFIRTESKSNDTQYPPCTTFINNDKTTGRTTGFVTWGVRIGCS